MKLPDIGVKMRHVMVLTPAYGGIVTSGFHKSLMTSTLELLEEGIGLESLILENQSLLPLARNTLLNDAYKTKPDDIVWIDTDMVWETDTLRKLLNHPVDVVGAPCRKKIPDKVEFNFQLSRDSTLEPDQNGLIEVRRLGTGFLRMTKKAYTHIWEICRKYEIQGVVGSNVFEVGIWNERELLSEDFIMCEKLMAEGFKIYMDPKLAVGHIGTFNYLASATEFFEFLKKKKADESATSGS
jgi:glycosyltransferase involved in cell wall biosynthesis